MIPSEIDPRVLGRRITEARKARGTTQEEAAGWLGCSRPTYIAIEKGDRAAQPDEIIKLAAFLGRKVSELVRPDEPATDLQLHLRAVADKMKGREAAQGALHAAIDEFQGLAEDYRELERLMLVGSRPSYPPEVFLHIRIDPVAQAEVVAEQERKRLGLGDQPVIALRKTLEEGVGLRIFYSDVLPSNIAGMYAYSADLGACMLINRKHPPERRRVSMLHQYSHFLLGSDRYLPCIEDLATSGRKAGVERFAEAFALGFLMPASSVRQRFQKTVTDTGDFQVADLWRMKNAYFVSLEAMTLRVEQLGLVPKGTWEHLKQSVLGPRKAGAMPEPPPPPIDDSIVPERYRLLAVKAYQRGEIGDADLAHYLRCDVVTAREEADRILTSRELGPAGEDLMVRMDFPRSLLGEPR